MNEINETKPLPKKNKRNIVVIVSLIIIILIALFLFFYNKLFSNLETVEITNDAGELMISTQIPQYEEITNYAIFGIDTRDNDYDGSRTDTIMIASLDYKHNKIKLSSIMRDTYVNIPGKKYDKINHAYNYGGAQLSIQTINQNFDMNIKDFVTVNFTALEKLVDAIGGVEINIKQNETSLISGNIKAGMQNLNGEQAVDYCRIRYVGNADYERTERQRRVMQQIISKLQEGTSLIDMLSLVEDILPYVETSLSKEEIMVLGAKVLASGEKTVEETRLPLSENSKGTMINGVYYLLPKSLKDNVVHLHKFIYETDDYEPTQTVTDISNKMD